MLALLVLLDPRFAKGSYEFRSVRPCVRRWSLVHWFFLIFCVMLGNDKLRKAAQLDFRRKISFLRIWANRAQYGPKIRFWGYSQKSNHWMSCFLCLNDRYHNYALFCENRMFGKNLVLDLWPKMVLTNQIARFFKFEYLKNGLTVWIHFLYDVIKP